MVFFEVVCYKITNTLGPQLSGLMWRSAGPDRGKARDVEGKTVPLQLKPKFCDSEISVAFLRYRNLCL